MTDSTPSGGDALAAGWDWLSTLPRAAVPHAERGEDPQAAVAGLLAALGDPQRQLRVIHVAGSKGKGSTALYLEYLLADCGLRTSTFTSPHLERWTERLRLDGSEVRADLALSALHAVQRAQRESGIRPGFFEALTVAGLWLAAEAGVDWAIVEAGVGGRADATNIVHPRLCIITGIELEHVDRLGDSVTAIAREKAGIVKPGAPLIAPALPADVDRVFADAAARAGTEHIRLRPAERPPRAGSDPLEVRWQHDPRGLRVAGAGWSVASRPGPAGRHMAQNAALALAGVARLGLCSRETLQRSARALATLQLPGRMETLSSLPWVIVDGAHTATSAEALMAAVAELQPERIHLLLSMSAGKDVDAVLERLLPAAARVTVTRADPAYSLDPGWLATAIRERRPDLPVQAEPDPETALGLAADDQPGGTLVLATGSVYLAGRIRALLPPGGTPSAGAAEFAK